MYGETTKGWAPTGNLGSYPVADTPVRASAIDGIGRSVADATTQVAELTQRAKSIADAVFGNMPEASQGIGTSPPVDGKFASIERETGALFAVIGALRIQIDRLTCI